MTGWLRALFDAIAMAIYVLIVYSASLTIGPLGRDYAMLANPNENASFLVARLISAEVHFFANSAWAYHCVNLGLLYACMLLLYRLTNRVVRGPWWFGTLAATLFMANPVHSEAVLNVCGPVDLLPCLLALASLMVYAESAFAPRLWSVLLSPVLFGLAILGGAQIAILLFVLILFELLVRPGQGNPLLRLALPAMLSVTKWCFTPEILSAARWDLTGMFAPLYFIVYPLGFLPATARTLVAYPILGWVAAASVLIILFLIHRKARRPVILFGLFGAAATRLCQGDGFVDPVHLIGGGQLLLANALFNIAFVALFYRIMDHPKWRRAVVTLTTLLCVVFFVLELRSVLSWRQASVFTHRFQSRAADEREKERVDGSICVFPDFQYYSGAPMCLSASLAYATPFSKAIGAVPLLRLHYSPDVKVHVTESSDAEVTVALHAVDPLDLLCYPYGLSTPGGREKEAGILIETVSISPETLTLKIRDQASLPPCPVLSTEILGAP
jgi:hypothetical protein